MVIIYDTKPNIVMSRYGINVWTMYTVLEVI